MIFGKTINTIIIGAVVINLAKENANSMQVPYRLTNEGEGAANGTQPQPTTAVIISAEEMPKELSADNLVGILIAKINETNSVQIELAPVRKSEKEEKE